MLAQLILQLLTEKIQMHYKRLLVFMALFCVGTALDLPPDFKKCKRSDGDFKGCLKTAIEDALPKLEKGLVEFNFPPIQPINMPSMTIGEGKTVQMVQNYKNLNLYGFTSVRIDSVEAEFTETGFDFDIDAFFPEIRAEADYELDGQIREMPIVGKGPCVVTYKDVEARFEIHADELGEKEQSYYEIKDFKVSLKPGRIIMNFTNLFDGDEKLSNETNQLMNENWKGIWDDIGASYEETFGLIFKELSNHIFKKIPHEQLFPL